MSIPTLFLYIIASFILNFLLQIIEKKKKDIFLNDIIISNIFMLILAGIFSTYHLTENNDNIFLIIFFQILGSVFYKQCIQEISIWQYNDNLIKRYLITLGSAYLLNILFINQTQNVFPNMEGFKLILWLLIIEYLYFSFKDYIKKNHHHNNQIMFYKDQEYIVMQYAKLKTRYRREVHSKYRELVPLVYAIMIYENYTRPEILRKLDHYKYQAFREQGKFGIMQIYSAYEISDAESIKLAIKKLEKIYQTLPKENKNSRYWSSKVMNHYYHKNVKAVISIYKNIIMFEKTK